MTDVEAGPSAWLIVWAGDGPWADPVARARDRVGPRHPDAHELLFTEESGERRALLLVHWTTAERDALVDDLRPRWAYHFVNAVRDLAD